MEFRKVEPGFADMARLDNLNREAFPPGEYVETEYLLERAGLGYFDFWALYDTPGFIGFMVVVPHGDLAYLSFFAIEAGLRSQGYGSAALQELPRIYPAYKQLVDIEMTDEKAGNNLQRVHRRGFYLRNGYCPTGQFLSYFGGSFEMLIKGGEFELEAYKRLVASLNVPEFKPVYFTKADFS